MDTPTSYYNSPYQSSPSSTFHPTPRPNLPPIHIIVPHCKPDPPSLSTHYPQSTSFQHHPNFTQHHPHDPSEFTPLSAVSAPSPLSASVSHRSPYSYLDHHHQPLASYHTHQTYPPCSTVSDYSTPSPTTPFSPVTPIHLQGLVTQYRATANNTSGGLTTASYHDASSTTSLPTSEASLSDVAPAPEAKPKRQKPRRHECPMCYKAFDRPSTLKKVRLHSFTLPIT